MDTKHIIIVFSVGLVALISISLSVKTNVLTQSQYVELGHFLFFDTRLSITGTKSCSTCHDPSLAFTDGYRRSQGVYADLSLHNSPSLLNLNSYKTFNWKSPEINTLQQQFKNPLFSKSPSELGLDSTDQQFIQNLFSQEPYSSYHLHSNSTWEICTSALESYLNQLVSRNSLFDKFQQNNLQYSDSTVLNGYKLFSSDKFKCIVCHDGVDFNMKELHVNIQNLPFHSKIENSNIYRIPSLRNVAITSPYMHDGSVEKLSDCLALNQHSNNKLEKIPITAQEERSILYFLHTLTDTSYFSNPLFKNPFTW